MKLLLSLPVLALLLPGLSPAEGPQDKQKPATQADQLPPRFDAAGFLQEYDINKDGYLSREELPRRLRSHFDKIDTNKDGKLSRQELEKGAVYLQSQRRPSDVAFILVEMSDCDEGCAEEVQRIYELMRKLDTNKDGKISADELRAGREAIIRERVDDLLEELDRNKDGKISKDEARGQIKIYFDKIDSNKDGLIDRQELIEASSGKPEKLVPAKGGSPKPSR